MSHTDAQPLSVRDAERFVGAVSRSGVSFSRDNYEALRYVRPDLPPWDALSAALRHSSLYARLVEDQVAIELKETEQTLEVSGSKLALTAADQGRL